MGFAALAANNPAHTCDKRRAHAQRIEEPVLRWFAAPAHAARSGG